MLVLMSLPITFIFKSRKKFLCLKYLLYSTEVQLDIYQEYVSQIYVVIHDGLYLVFTCHFAY